MAGNVFPKRSPKSLAAERRAELAATDTFAGNTDERSRTPVTTGNIAQVFIVRKGKIKKVR